MTLPDYRLAVADLVHGKNDRRWQHPESLAFIGHRYQAAAGQIGPCRRACPAPVASTSSTAARGLTNKQIGARLFLTPRTVGTYLYRAYPKLGISTRAALRDALTGVRPEDHSTEAAPQRKSV
jgi:hypothetical protein